MSAARCGFALALALPLLAAAAEAPPAQAAPGTPEAPRQLKIYQKVMPVYPAIGEGSEGGCVTVRYRILHTGFVGEVTVVEAKPAALAEPTVAAMKQWVFQSFPPTEAEITAVQTFNYAPDRLRMPDDAIRGSLAALGDDGALGSAGCGATKPVVTGGKPVAATKAAKAKKP
ncbi:MAG: energy transducer TonB [Gammaproteobacteria bacterium]